jgi:hypothetical protein
VDTPKGTTLLGDPPMPKKKSHPESFKNEDRRTGAPAWTQAAVQSKVPRIRGGSRRLRHHRVQPTLSRRQGWRRKRHPVRARDSGRVGVSPTSSISTPRRQSGAIADANHREHESTGKLPALVFEHAERAARKPLAPRPFDTDHLDSDTVTASFRVRFDRNQNTPSRGAW